MRYIELLTLRERTIRDRFLTEALATDDQKKEYVLLLDRITGEADKDLFDQLSELFGADEARRLIAQKQRTEQANL